jgi:hypothetical protein
MSVIKDFSSKIGYKKLEFVEFLDFLGRIAHEKYTSDELLMHEKIEKVLDLVLPIVGEHRKPMQLLIKVLKEEINWDHITDSSSEEHDIIVGGQDDI